MKYYFLILCLLILACNTAEYDKKSASHIKILDTLRTPQSKPTLLHTVVRKIITENKNYKDTATYTFTLEGNFSAEGNEGIAIYKGGNIYKIDLTFYGEMGKSTYSYLFGTENINVVQNVLNYDSTLSGNIKSSEKISYDINYEGDLIVSDVVGADTDTFLELKKSVPFTLK